MRSASSFRLGHTLQYLRHLCRLPQRLSVRAMTTFRLENSEPPCSVILCAGLSKEALLSHKPFQQWLNSLQTNLKTQNSENHAFNKAPYALRSIEIQAVDMFGHNRIGFIKFKANVTNDEGEFLPGAVFLRGGSVAMLVILQPDDVPEASDEEQYTILTIQPRIAAGSLAFPEIPAGMLDNAGTFSGGAAKELREETGLEVHEDELIDLTALAADLSPGPPGEVLQNAVYPSPGGCDEFIPIFLCRKRIAREKLRDFQGKLTGLRDEGEKITLKIVKLNELWKEGCRDGKTLAAYALYSGLKGEGKI
ncbi:uncharacterized protein PV09_07845 [Verruconis gallopava]|uniref:Nudix hydrolase domain-containing protein n=1 Tax=Verruconis gallopava TaxID=253628 RepID=A0A0D2A1Q1_9PEZI|nr:uncharacterized protein PV09_07845 [Verruconis gallopava]KIW00658.1 hypothetical protein PV09_07845 [Verruconis gallopava]